MGGTGAKVHGINRQFNLPCSHSTAMQQKLHIITKTKTFFFNQKPCLELWPLLRWSEFQVLEWQRVGQTHAIFQNTHLLPGSLKTDWFQFPTEMISSDFLFVNTETPTSLASKEYTQTHKSGSSVFQGLRGICVIHTQTQLTHTTLGAQCSRGIDVTQVLCVFFKLERSGLARSHCTSFNLRAHSN